MRSFGPKTIYFGSLCAQKRPKPSSFVIDRPKWHSRLSTEAEEQKTLIKLLRLQGIGLFSVPNEGKRPARTSGQLNALGRTRGAPDLVLTTRAPIDGRPVAIEMKGKGGEMSPAQIAIHRQLCQDGWHALVGWGCDHAYGQLIELGYGLQPL
jgi:hypothetical protein